MSEYTEILPDGTRRVVKYKRGVGIVSELIKAKARLKWLLFHPQFSSGREVKRLNNIIFKHSRKLDKVKTRQTVAQSKYRPVSDSTKGRFQTNNRKDNPEGLAVFGGDVAAPGNRPAPIRHSTAALALMGGCEDKPQGCTNAVAGQTAVGLNRPE